MAGDDVTRARLKNSDADTTVADLAAAGVDVNDQSGKENLLPLVPPVGHPQRAEALEFLRLPLTASEEDVRRRIGELLRVDPETNLPLNAQGQPLAPGEHWEPDPTWNEYSARFIIEGKPYHPAS